MSSYRVRAAFAIALALLPLGCPEPRLASSEPNLSAVPDAEIVRRFTEIYYGSDVWKRTAWPGDAATHPLFQERVETLIGDSVSPEIVEQIAERVRGDHTVIVTLDSHHGRDHVLRELELYAPFVSVGSYLVVQDSVINGNLVLPESGPGPMQAIREFLADRDDFVVDRSREKFLLTFYPRAI